MSDAPLEGQRTASADEAIVAARKSRAQGDDIQARGLLDAALAITPDDLDLRLESANLIAAEKGYPAAVEALRLIVDDAPTSPGLYDALGRFARKAGLYDEAERALMTGLLLRPDDTTLRVELARTYEDQGKVELAKATLKATATAKGVPAVAVAAYSRLHRVVDDAPAMIRILERALSQPGLAPNDQQMLVYEITLQHALLGRIEEASAFALRGIRDFGDHKPMVEAMRRLWVAGKMAEAAALVTDNMAEINARTGVGVHLQRRLGQLQRAGKSKRMLEASVAKGGWIVKVVGVKDDTTSLIDIDKLGRVASPRRPLRFKDSTFKNRNVNNGFDRLGGLLDAEHDRLVLKGDYAQPIFDRYDWSIYQMTDAYQAQAGTGYSALVSRQGYFLAETVETYHPLIIREQMEAYRGNETIGEAVSLPRISPRNYYHLLVSDIAPLHLYQDYLSDKMLYISGEFRRDVTDLFLGALGIAPDRVIFAGGDRNPLIERCYVPFKTIGMVDEVTYRLTSYVGAEVKKDAPVFSNRIYISRLRSKNRPLVCESAVEDLARSRGFKIVYMEEHDFRTQVAIMANAEVVFAPHGAGLANLLFCAPGTRVIEMQANEYCPSTFFRMSKVCGFDYYPILGFGDMERTSKSDQLYWDIDLKKVEMTLDTLGVR